MNRIQLFPTSFQTEQNSSLPDFRLKKAGELNSCVPLLNLDWYHFTWKWNSSSTLNKRKIVEKVKFKRIFYLCFLQPTINLKHWNTGLVSSRVSLTSWGGGTSLALVGHASSDGITRKNTIWGRCFITSTSVAPHLFLLDWLKQSDFIGSVETGLGKWTLVVAVISVDTYPVLAFSDLTSHLEDTRLDVFWLYCAAW